MYSIFYIMKKINLNNSYNIDEDQIILIEQYNKLIKIFKLIEKQHYVLVYKHINNLLNNNKNIIDELQDLHLFLNKNPDINTYLNNY